MALRSRPNHRTKKNCAIVYLKFHTFILFYVDAVRSLCLPACVLIRISVTNCLCMSTSATLVCHLKTPIAYATAIWLWELLQRMHVLQTGWLHSVFQDDRREAERLRSDFRRGCSLEAMPTPSCGQRMNVRVRVFTILNYPQRFVSLGFAPFHLASSCFDASFPFLSCRYGWCGFDELFRSVSSRCNE